VTWEDAVEIFERERSRFVRAGYSVEHAALVLRKFKRKSSRDCAEMDPNTGVISFHPDAGFLTRDQVTALIRHELAHVADDGLTEAGTDKLAERVTGERIYYGPDDIQTTVAVGGQRPRPKRLPR
jgi:hypothetical protein